MQEVSFWLNLERALHQIKDKRDGTDITLTLEVLKHGKRFHATVSFDSDTGLQKALETVNNYNPLMKDFPLNGLLGATDTEQIKCAVVDIFAHMKKIRNTKYPITRALKLVQAISRDLNDQLLKVLGTQRLMHVTHEEFDRILYGCKRVFDSWEEEDEKFRNILRDLLKRKRDDTVKTFRRILPEHRALQERLEVLGNFRKQHEQLRTVIVRVLKPAARAGEAEGLMDADDVNAIEEVNLAYEDVKNVDPLDLGEAGNAAFENAKKRYDERIDRVETRITAKLRDQLGTAKNANEMFRIFSKFNALFVRPRIRGAIREYQTQLIQRVKADIETLHEKFKVSYSHTLNAKMSELRDLPPVSGHIIWARQIDRQLSAYLQRVEDVLGRGWENHVEGRALKEDGDSFRHKLDTQPLFDKWAAEVTARQLGVSGRIFDIELKRGIDVELYLAVNFHPQIITLSKEVRNLKWLGFRVPLVIVNKALQANHLYPFAISLKASVRTYQQTLDKLAANDSVRPLVANYHKAIQTRIAEGVTLRWESYRLENFVQGLAEDVFTFQEKVDDLLIYNEKLNKLITSLEKCPLTKKDFSDLLGEIQRIVDYLNLKAYVNLEAWVKTLDQEVEKKLVHRLESAILLWTIALKSYGDKDDDWDARETGLTDKEISVKDLPHIEPMTHEILIRNQVMFLNPPAERAMENLLSQFQQHIAIITSLNRIQTTPYVADDGNSDLDKSASTYRGLMTKLPRMGQEVLVTYDVIDQVVAKVSEYARVWLQYQALWDMQTDMIIARLGDNLDMWQKLLVAIKKARRTFDTSETSKSFGPVIMNYSQVQTKVNLKYDQLHKDILARFAGRLNTSMTEFYSIIQRARQDLEGQSIETASTQDAVSYITIIQELKRKLNRWGEDVEVFRVGQKVLERQRYPFPDDWLHSDMVDGEWAAFNDILSRKDLSIQGQVATLQMKVVEEDRALERRINDLINDWDKNKPIGGDVNPDQATNTLSIFESRFQRAKEESDALAKAKHALDLDVKPDDRIGPRLEELRDLKSSWSELSRIWSNITDLKSMPWSAVVPRQIRAKLDDLVSQLKNLPARVRSYASYEYTMDSVNDYIKMNVHVTSLKSEALKDRHWKTLMKSLGVSWVLSDLTLGEVWEADLSKHAKEVQEVMNVAQGEMGLEEYLRTMREEWNARAVDLVPYQNKTNLIKGWDELLTLAKEHLNSLTAMRGSPYFKSFEEEVSTWEDKLNRIFSLFDVWMDVQRSWVYLEGIFTGSEEIKHLLPGETSRFMSINSDFLALMKKVSKNNLVLEIINIPNAQISLNKLKDLLAKVQKALGEYLEQERSQFPRFYFVGDEDLLEIIGNSKNPDKIQKHFGKMFAGIQTLILSDGMEQCVGFSSKEGEEVVFKTPVQLKGEKINIWLTNVETEMRVSLAKLLADSVQTVSAFADKFNLDKYLQWLDQFQAQLVVISVQIMWSTAVDAALKTAASSGENSALQRVLANVENTLNSLADTVLLYQPHIRRKKLEHVITEMVHQRDVTRDLLAKGIMDNKDFDWLSQMRFYFNPKEKNVLQQLTIKLANADFFYGFEYLGLTEKLVQTPLTDRAYMTLTQGLKARQGGAPFGPAGTGKTESVKALGAQLGRFVLVFNCDETFDAEAMKRIFMGLCQVGAWGCFDEFNRLEEAQLSAVSQQIQTIQLGLKDMATKPDVQIEIVANKPFKLNSDVGLFITMNPGYAGRSNLPDNLKRLFRNLAMTKPDRQLIAQVMLYSQGFRTAEALSKKVVPLFILCAEQLSAQSHYDFGLRALKSVLVSAGGIKRKRMETARQAYIQRGQAVDEEAIAAEVDEQDVLIQSVSETMIPKLVAEDIPLLKSLLQDVFPGVQYTVDPMEELRARIEEVAAERHLVLSETFMTKVLQTYLVTNINHGLMLVGPSGAGKTSAWQLLLEALRRWEKKDAFAHVLDPKAMSKDDLYGFLDPTTREWTDGLFTQLIRKIIANHRGELEHRQWIIFDGDVDPEWVENLNSVLDDNKLLTLPNGERLNLPPNVRVMFEVQDLKNATLATVSRCGMIWFSEDVVELDMYFTKFLNGLRAVPLDVEDGGDAAALAVQQQVADILTPHFASDGLITRAMEFAANLEHVMVFTNMRAINSLFCMMNSIARAIIDYNVTRPDFPMPPEQIEAFTTRRMVYYVMWCLVGDTRGIIREELSKYLRSVSTIQLPPEGNDILIDYEATLEGQWALWKNKVPEVTVEPHQIAGTDVVVPTLDTVRHVDLLYTWLKEHLPVILCGPPGSGKTMTLFSALRALPDFEVVGLNFSSATSPELILDTFKQFCELRMNTPKGNIMAPTQLNKWLVIFMDECNLPAADKYSTVRVITFVRQLIEQGGYWKREGKTTFFVQLERIQFVGACNPPTDPGRVPLDLRFLRHCPVVYVDYPSAESYKQIYGTFNRALMKLHPDLRGYADPLTDAMVDFFMQTQRRFTADMQPFYIYSPREMTRWIKGIKEAIQPLDTLSVEGLVRLWAHEALRLFQDRLVYDEERKWTDEHIDSVAATHFPGIDLKEALRRPILYSTWLSKNYVPVEREELREYVKARLKTFYEEELDVPLVLFNEVLDHVLRIDRIYRQNQGHLLLIGVSGGGKTTLSRFVAWMNNLHVFQVKVHNQYTADHFDEDLRNVLRRAGTKGEKIVFIMDEGNVMDTAFLERMNTLLANGEVPGLFEGDELAALMNQCKEGSARENLVLDGNDELYKWFSGQVMRNLHVVFTMNPSEGGMQDRAATSPALFNRCVLDWFGDWSDNALYQVANEFTLKIDLDKDNYTPPMGFPVAYPELPEPPTHRQAVVNAFVYVHQSVRRAVRRQVKREGSSTHVTPRHFLEFVNQFVSIYHEKRDELEEQQRHLTQGLQKIKETVEQVEEMQKTLAGMSEELRVKNEQANAKLQQMVKDQQEAEEKKAQSEKLGKELEVRQAKALEKQEKVQGELAGVLPALEAAREAVGGVSKKALVELKSLTNPPKAVKDALEATCCLLGFSKRATDWKGIRSVVLQDNFLQMVQEFKSEQISSAVQKEFQSKYTAEPEDAMIDKAYKASKVCGPLMTWCFAQMKCSTVLLMIEPLTNELKSLQAETASMQQQQTEVAALVAELEKSIAKYKEEYALLIAEAERIKKLLQECSEKVDRSVTLLKSLDSERTRWAKGSEGFNAQMATVVGDALLSSAFMGYAGYFDQSYRASLMSKWLSQLAKSQIDFRPELSIAEFLSTPDERLRWKQNELPSDDLCTENAIMLQRFIRFPLIIDPAGQATDFVLNEWKSRNISETSFLDPNFRKHLENALRFGTPLLVRDAEAYDPILNPVLNKEVKKAGGRHLICIGDSEIDLSPKFSITLTTRNATHLFAADLTSRVTMVNFSVTRASLQSQCLNQVLKAERPEVDKKRSDLLKVQGEFRLRLHQLEKSLLQSLNEAKGSLLDDNVVITKLETIKKEAAEIQEKVAASDKVMEEIELTSRQYLPLAQRCSAIYFTLQQLNMVHFIYLYSLQFFLDIFTVCLKGNPHLADLPTDQYDKRLEVIKRDLFQIVYDRVSPGMLHADRVGLAMTLALLDLRGTPNEPNAQELAAFMAGAQPSMTAGNFASFVPHTLSQEAAFAAFALSNALPVFKDLQGAFQGKEAELRKWFESSRPELTVPEFVASSTPVVRSFRELLLLQSLRPDRVLAKCHEFIDEVLGKGFMNERSDALSSAVLKEVDCKTPLLLFGVSGYDPSANVYDLSVASNNQLKQIAIGSAEGFKQAEESIHQASRAGRWVMLKNVHLAPNWLLTMEKTLSGLTPHQNFRLFLTTEINPKLPGTLISGSRVFVFEPASGVKAGLLRTLNSFPPEQISRAPAERGKLYFLIAWLHAVIQERLRYAPLGWSKKYEFGEADLRASIETIDQWMDEEGKGRSNLPPDKIPWDALATLLSQAIYGGRVDNEIDARLLTTFVRNIIRESSFNADFPLVKANGPDEPAITAPEGFKRDQFLAWAHNLPNSQLPYWLGLPNNAEKVVLTVRGRELAAKVKRKEEEEKKKKRRRRRERERERERERKASYCFPFSFSSSSSFSPDFDLFFFFLLLLFFFFFFSL